MICDFRKDRPSLFPRVKTVNSQLRLSEAASPRIQLINEVYHHSAVIPQAHRFNINRMVWEVKQVKPGSKQMDKTHSWACGRSQHLSYRLLRRSRKAAFYPSTNVSLKPGKNASVPGLKRNWTEVSEEE